MDMSTYRPSLSVRTDATQSSPTFLETQDKGSFRRLDRSWKQQRPRTAEPEALSSPVKHLDPAQASEVLDLVSQWINKGSVPGSPFPAQDTSSVSSPKRPHKNKDQSRLAKGMSRIKTWVRGSKTGLVFRVRRSLDIGDDVVTDLHINPDHASIDPGQEIGRHNFLTELDGDEQQILELPTEACELPSESFDPPSYSTINPRDRNKRMWQHVDVHLSGTTDRPDQENVAMELDVLTPNSASISATGAPDMFNGVTRLHSCTRLLRKIKEERERSYEILFNPSDGYGLLHDHVLRDTAELAPAEAYLHRTLAHARVPDHHLSTTIGPGIDRRSPCSVQDLADPIGALSFDTSMQAPGHQCDTHSLTRRRLGLINSHDDVGSLEDLYTAKYLLQNRACHDQAVSNVHVEENGHKSTDDCEDVPRLYPKVRVRSRCPSPGATRTVSAPISPTGKDHSTWQRVDSVDLEITSSTLRTSGRTHTKEPHNTKSLVRPCLVRSQSLPEAHYDRDPSNWNAALPSQRKDTNYITAGNTDSKNSIVSPPASLSQIAPSASNSDHQQPTRGFCALAVGSLLGLLDQGTAMLREWAGSNDIAHGHVRVRWKCACGAELHDDFVELRNGAVSELEAQLNGFSSHSNATSPSSAGSSPTRESIFSSPSENSRSSTRTGTPDTSASNSPDGSKPFEPFPSTSPPMTRVTIHHLTPSYLLTCANEGRFTPKLTHLDMSPHKVSNDKDLATALRTHYFDLNNKWYHAFRLRGLTKIDFVLFRAHKNRFADICKRPDMPDASDPEYIFKPDIIPPVGSNYLIHLLNHPQDYEDECIALERMPKRASKLGDGQNGWGIELVETFLPDRVWALAFCIFGLGSLVFGIVWGARKHDIQGAFGVAAWMCGLAMLLFGWIQACLG